MSRPLVEARGLVKHFPGGRRRWGSAPAVVQAISGVDLQVFRGETLGIVGESGCGKSTLGRLLLRLVEPTAGEVWFDGRRLGDLRPRALRRLRREMQIVFQDPFGSLDPRMPVGEIVAEGIDIHRLARGAARREAVERVLVEVGLRPEHATRFPHEFSGGQRQRIGIARALAVDPRFLVCDEPVSALDVSVQAQVVNLLADLRRQRRLTCLFIAHDLRVVAHLSDRIAVLYAGRVIEVGTRDQIVDDACHPYTRALLAAVHPNPEARQPRQTIPGDPPSPLRPPSGCAFHPRCPHAEARCRNERPSLVSGNGAHVVACHVFRSGTRVEPGESATISGSGG